MQPVSEVDIPASFQLGDGASIAALRLAKSRHFVGHDRYSGSVAGQAMAHLYGAGRQYVNYFQPSFNSARLQGFPTVQPVSEVDIPASFQLVLRFLSVEQPHLGRLRWVFRPFIV